MHLFIGFILFTITFFFSSQCFAVKEYTLTNGIKVLIIEDSKSPLATFQIWYKVGSKDEPYGKTGISHLLEHMMFKGTSKYSSKEFSNIIQKNGGVDNAFTTKDYTMYYQTLSSDRIHLSFELESDRMTNLLLDSKEVESERKVVMEERRMRYEDDPQNALYEDLIASAFKVHSYRWPVIGWMSDIASISKDDLYKHYKSFYCPTNAFIIISGDVNAESIMPAIKEKFQKIPPCTSNSSDIKEKLTYQLPTEPEQKGQKRIYLKKEAQLPYITMAYHLPSFPHEDSYALEVLSIILAGGKSSRLYQNIVYEKRLALNVYAEYYGLYRYPFLFFFGGTASPLSSIEDLEKGIYTEIEKISKEPPSLKEVQKAKNQIEASFVFAQDSNFSKGLYTGLFELSGSWKLLEKYLEGIRKVTPENVKSVANKYLIDDKKTVGVLVPIKNEAAQIK
jgi:zinc protease